MWETIANISKRNYNSFTKAIHGEYIADHGNKLFFINADYNKPYISKFILLDDQFETNMAYAKDLIKMKKGIRPGTEMRCKLLKKFMDMGMSSSMIVEITHQLAGKTDPEKEKIAKRILMELDKTENT